MTNCLWPIQRPPQRRNLSKGHVIIVLYFAAVVPFVTPGPSRALVDDCIDQPVNTGCQELPCISSGLCNVDKEGGGRHSLGTPRGHL